MCHTDLHELDNDWGNPDSFYPFIPATRSSARSSAWANPSRPSSPFAVPIPPALYRPETAPLMCAGITVFNPIVLHQVRPGMRAAVVGLGGLGHLGVKFLSAHGCDVTVITRDAGKEPDARRFGAGAFPTSPDNVADKSLDFILVTATGRPGRPPFHEQAARPRQVCASSPQSPRTPRSTRST